jgi:hypothetical protein
LTFYLIITVWYRYYHKMVLPKSLLSQNGISIQLQLLADFTITKWYRV